MRQAGFLAAAALHALEHHVDRLAEDHAHARRLAAGLAELPGVKVEPARVETNILLVDFPRPSGEMVTRLKALGLLTNAFGPYTIRFVCHLDVSAADMDEALGRIRKALET